MNPAWFHGLKINDSVPYLSRLVRQIDTFKFQLEAVALESGYLTIPIYKGINERNIFRVIAHRRYSQVKGLFPKYKFKYNAQKDLYIFPNSQELR